MKVLMVHGRYRSAAPSGENAVVDRESALLTGAGHQVELFTRHSDEIASWGPARKAMLPLRSVRNPEVRRDLGRQLRSLRPDVVHVHNTFPLLSASVLHACHDAGVPVVATLHNYKLLCASGDFFRDGSPCHACATRTAAPALRHGCYRGSRVATAPVVAGMQMNRRAWQELVSAYIFISSAQRDLMGGLDLARERIFVKHNFVPPTVPAAERRPEHLVVFVGRLDAAKGAPLLMRAWDLFRTRQRDSGLRLAIAGGGMLESETRAWAARHGSVEVLGHLPPDDVGELLRRATAAVIPSQWEETFGLVAIEAMAAGVAPVAPARGSFPELVTHGVDGTLFEPGSPGGLARVLEDVDHEPDRYVAMGRQGLTTHQERFHPTRNLEQLLGIYRYAAANPARPGAVAS